MVKRNLSRDMAMERSTSKRSKISPTTKAAFKKVARQVVLKMAETKVFRTGNFETLLPAVTPGNIWFALSAITQGVNYGQRVGREIQLKDIDLRYTLKNNTALTSFVRVVVCYTTDDVVPDSAYEVFDGAGPNDPPLSFNTVMLTPSNAHALTLMPLNKSKIITVYDKVHRIGAGTSLDGQDAILTQVRRSLRNAKIQFEANTSGALNQNKSLFLGAWAVDAAADNNIITVEMSHVVGIKYTDL